MKNINLEEKNQDRIIDFRYAPDIIQTCIGLVDDAHKTIVREDGSLNYNYQITEIDIQARKIPAVEDISGYVKPQNRNLDFLHRLKPVFSHRDKFIKKSQYYGDPAMPFVTTSETYENTKLTWKIFASQSENGLRADVIHWTMEANDSFNYAPSKVELLLDGPEEGLPLILESPRSTAYWNKDGVRLPGISQYSFLKAGDEREGVFAVVLEGELSPDEVTVQWAEKAEQEMVHYWKNINLFENDFEIPEPQIMDMLKACARNILQAREENEGVLEFQVGPTMYRGLWVVDGHFLLEAAHMMGKHFEAYRGVTAVLNRAKTDGSIQILQDHYKETGIALATFVRQCELMNDDQKLKELWPTMIKALMYIKSLREKAKELGPEYKGHELFPPALLDGGVAGPYAEYTTPLWMLVGLKMSYDAGKRLGLSGYEQFGEFFESLQESVQRSIKRDTRTTAQGITYFPMNMEMSDFDCPQSATWALAHAIYPGEIFSSDSKIVEDFLKLLDSIDNQQGIPENTGWIHDQAIWGYSSMFYAQVWLYAGYHSKAVDYLYAFANHASPSRVWREEQTLNDSFSNEYCGDMPHNWASAEFIRLVRHLLVFERGYNLEIFPGLPENWLPNEENPLILKKTPSKFGEISIRLTKKNSGTYELTGSIEKGNKVPDKIILHWNGEVIESTVNFDSRAKYKWEIPGSNNNFRITFNRKS